LFRCNGFSECGHDSLNVRKRGVLVNRIVADHHIRFAHEDRRADHFAPEIGLRGDMGDDHLADAAIFGVLLHDYEPPGLVD